MRKQNIEITKLQLLKLQEMYKTDLIIAKMLNLSVARICQLRKKFGISIITSKSENIKRNNDIYKMFTFNHMSKKDLSKAFNLTQKTIRMVLKSFKGKEE